MIFPAYLYFSTIDNSDITPSHPVFGKIDQEDSILSSGQKEKILGLTFFIEHFIETNVVHEEIPSCSPQLPPLNSNSLILRC